MEDEFEKKWGWQVPDSVATPNRNSDTTDNESENMIKMEADEKDELGPILDSGPTFRTRCYTWPRQYLEGHWLSIDIFSKLRPS